MNEDIDRRKKADRPKIGGFAKNVARAGVLITEPLPYCYSLPNQNQNVTV